MDRLDTDSPFFRSLGYLGRWILIALLSAVVAVVVVNAVHLLITSLRRLVLSNAIPIPAAALVGALVAALISRIDPESRGEGLPSYIRGVRESGGDLSLRASLVKLGSAFATLSFWGSGGYVGPLGRIVAGISSRLTAIVRPEPGPRSSRRTAAVCGLAAATSVVLGAPIGGGFFAVEIIQKRDMRYSDLFPAVLAGSVALFLSRNLGFEPLFSFEGVTVVLGIRHVPALLTTALLAALAARGFEGAYAATTRWIRRDRHNLVELKFVAATAAALGLTWWIQPEMLGTGRIFMHDLYGGTAAVGRADSALPLAVAAILAMLVRGLATVLTVGSGQSAGFFAPLALIGMLLGTAVATVFGVAGQGPDLCILQAAGFAGLIAGSLNVPLAAAIIVSEMFGPSLGFAAAFAAILGFQLNRHHTVYDVMFEGAEDDEDPNRSTRAMNSR